MAWLSPTRLLQRPAWGLAALCAAQALLWSLAPLLSHDAPPLDVVEMYAWGREGVVATFKHPNLPGLVLEGLRRLTGAAGWPAFFVSQAFIAATFACVFALGRQMMDEKSALAGTALLTGVAFFSWPTPEFNHNVAQMPLWAGIALLLWSAVEKGGLWRWALLGLIGGLSLWAKYSSAVFLLLAFVWLVWDPRARKSFLTAGPYVALVAFLVSASPQIIWLFEHAFQPLAYAARRAAGGGIGEALEFLPVQALNHLPFFILLACAGLFGKKSEAAPEAIEQRALRFLLLLGLGPAVLTALMGLVTGSGLKTAWAAPMFNLSGLLAMALLREKIAEPRLKRVLIGAGVLLVLVPALYFTQMRFGPNMTGKPLRGNWPQAEISETLEAAWADETGGAPLRVVAGDIWTAGLIGMSDRRPPSVLINGDFEISPWATRDEVRRDGALIIWRGEDVREPMEALLEGLPQRTAIIPFRRHPSLSALELHYAVLPPSGDD